MQIDLTKATTAEEKKQTKQIKMINQISNSEKACIAANFLGTEWNKATSQAVYKDDSTQDCYICESSEEMVDLYDLITSTDSDTRRDAYSIWCSQTSHEIA